MPVMQLGTNLITRNQLLDAFCKLLLEVDGVHGCVKEVGGVPRWAETARERQTHWQVSIGGFTHDPPLVGGQPAYGRILNRTWQVVIQGWTPWHLEYPNSTEFWNDVVDAVAQQLIQHRSLKGYFEDPEVSVQDVRPPNASAEDFEAFTGNGPDGPIDVVAHHVALTVEAIGQFGYQTQ